VTAKGASKVAVELEGVLATQVVDLSGSEPVGSPSGSVVVGTEALLLGAATFHRVVFLDFDQLLWGSEIGTNLHAAYLLARAVELTSTLGGSITVMTSSRNGLVVQCGLHRSFEELYRIERDLRRELDLPPYRHFARVRGAEGRVLVVRHSAALGAVGVEVIPLDEATVLLAAQTPQLMLAGIRAVFELVESWNLQIEFSLRSP
jgi:primosomal protein N'